MTLNTHKICFMGKRTQKTLKILKMTPFCVIIILHEKRLKNDLILEIGHFAKAIAKQNGQ